MCLEDLDWYDSYPHQEGVPHGPYKPFSDEDVAVRHFRDELGERPPVDDIVYQMSRQLGWHSQHIQEAALKGEICWLSHKILKMGIYVAFKEVDYRV